MPLLDMLNEELVTKYLKNVLGQMSCWECPVVENKLFIAQNTNYDGQKIVEKVIEDG